MSQHEGLRDSLLARHKRRNPSHVLIGWDGKPLACGTCMEIPHGLLQAGAVSWEARHVLPRSHPQHLPGGRRAVRRRWRYRREHGLMGAIR